MNPIEKNNMDEWLFDYFEGNLNDSQQNTVDQFIQANPDLQTDYDSWKESYIKAPEMEYPRTPQLLMDDAFISSTFAKWGLTVLALLLVAGSWYYFSLPTEGPIGNTETIQQEVQPAMTSSSQAAEVLTTTPAAPEAPVQDAVIAQTSIAPTSSSTEKSPESANTYHSSTVTTNTTPTDLTETASVLPKLKPMTSLPMTLASAKFYGEVSDPGLVLMPQARVTDINESQKSLETGKNESTEELQKAFKSHKNKLRKDGSLTSPVQITEIKDFGF